MIGILRDWGQTFGQLTPHLRSKIEEPVQALGTPKKSIPTDFLSLKYLTTNTSIQIFPFSLTCHTDAKLSHPWYIIVQSRDNGPNRAARRTVNGIWPYDDGEDTVTGSP